MIRTFCVYPTHKMALCVKETVCPLFTCVLLFDILYVIFDVVSSSNVSIPLSMSYS